MHVSAKTLLTADELERMPGDDSVRTELEGSLVALAIPIAIAAWALSVILSAQRRPTTDGPTM
jgi:hypothetical protein